MKLMVMVIFVVISLNAQDYAALLEHKKKVQSSKTDDAYIRTRTPLKQIPREVIFEIIFKSNTPIDREEFFEKYHFQLVKIIAKEVYIVKSKNKLLNPEAVVRQIKNNEKTLDFIKIYTRYHLQTM